MTKEEKAQRLHLHLLAVIELSEDEISSFLLNNARSHPKDLVRVTAERFKLSRQAVQARLRKLIDSGSIRASGTTRNRTYELGPIGKHAISIPVDESLEEDVVWKTFCAPNCEGLADNVVHILEYGFTELVNNVRDHSESPSIVVGFGRTKDAIELVIIDSGVGIFQRIRGSLGLSSDNQALLELRKGKLTTDPSRHSGEGIFFTSKMMDVFSIFSGRIAWSTGAGQEDWIVELKSSEPGTRVIMRLDADTKRQTREIFAAHADPESDQGISRTKVILRLIEPEGPGLVSRSQAKRVLSRLEHFQTVFLDFEGVKEVGPAFLDEIFRVFARDHPRVLLQPMKVPETLKDLVDRAIRMGKSEIAAKLNLISEGEDRS